MPASQSETNAHSVETATAVFSITLFDTLQAVQIRFDQWGELLEYQPYWFDLPLAARRLMLSETQHEALEERLDNWRERLCYLLPILTRDDIRDQKWPERLEHLRVPVRTLSPASPSSMPYPGNTHWIIRLAKIPSGRDQFIIDIFLAMLQALAGSEAEVATGTSLLVKMTGSARLPLICLLGEQSFSAYYYLARSGEITILESAQKKLGSPNPAVRKAAREVLAHCSYYGAVDMLLRHLPEQEDERIHTYWAFAALADNRAGGVLLDALEQATTDENRFTILDCLRQIGPPEAPELALRLLDHPDNKFKMHALSLVNRMNRNDAIEHKIMVSLRHEKTDWNFVTSLVDTISRIGSPASIPALLEAFQAAKTDLHPYTCKTIASALHRLGYSGALQLLDKHNLVQAATNLESVIDTLGQIGGNAGLEFLKQHLDPASPFEQTCLALARINTPESLQLLISAVHHPDDSVALEAIKRLGERKCKAATPALAGCLGHPVRTSAALKSMAQAGDSNAVPAILRMIAASKDAAVTMQAWNVLGRLHEATALDPLLRYLSQNIPVETKGKMVMTLSLMQQPAAIPVLHTRLGKETPEIEALILMALGRLGDRKAFDLLKRQSESPHEQIATGAAKGLEFLNLPETIPHWRTFTHRRWPEVRRIALKMLVQSGDQESTKILIAGLGSTNTDLRREFIRALADGSSQAFVEPLIGVLADPFDFARIDAIRSLARYQHPAAKAALSGMLQDTNLMVREAAFEAIYPPLPYPPYFDPYLQKWSQDLFNEDHI